MIPYSVIKECRELVLQGVSVKDIANFLGITQSSVRLYTKSEMKVVRERKKQRQLSLR